MAAAAFAVFAFAVCASTTVFVVRWLDYIRTESIVERRLQAILAHSEL